MKRISVVGMGFVGLSLAVYLALKGYKIIVTEIDSKKVELINKGIPPFFELDLKKYLQEVVKNGSLTCIKNNREAILATDITFITVGTPSKPDGSIDLRYIESVANEIGEALKDKDTYHLIVVKSTVIPGTTENLIKPILEKCSAKKAGEHFGLAMSPEFLREGFSIYDLANPDRVVIGEFDKISGNILEELYRKLYKNKIPILKMNLASAELAKYASNAFLATKISFINQIANLCERIRGVDVAKIAHVIGLDPRIGSEFLKAGAGWGGSCLPKDTKALIALSKKLGCEIGLIEEAILINELQAKHMVELAEEELGNLINKRIAVLGLSFKPNTDDIREATSLKIIKLLLAKGAEVVTFDPLAMSNVKKVLSDKISYSNSMYECLRNADCCMLVTEWNEFKKIQPSDFIKFMRNPLLIDGRKIYDPEILSKKLKLRAIGLGKLTE